MTRVQAPTPSDVAAIATTADDVIDTVDTEVAPDAGTASSGLQVDAEVAWRPAGLIRRGIATVIDMLIFSTLSVIVLWPAIRAVDWATAAGGVDLLAKEVAQPQNSGHLAAVFGMWIAMWWAYFAVGWGLWGATPGKWMVGLRVVDHQGRCPIGFLRSMLRLVAYCVSSLTLGAGHLLIVFRGDKGALHDVLAGTRVCRRPRRSPPNAALRGNR
jgi:uncharacterized RDD family membrane protein YckC